LVWREDKAIFCEKTESGEFIPCAERQNVTPFPEFTHDEKSKLWLERDYETALRRLIDSNTQENEEEQLMLKKSKRFGEINFPEAKDKGFFYSDQFGLLSRE
jgi:CRISPR-associated endonuclease/helicase Cas3